MYGLNPLNPFYKRANVDAALIIQRAYRVHRSRTIAARKRYEMWSRAAALQGSMIAHLSEANALTGLSYRIMRLLGLGARKRIRFDETSHLLIPGRLLALIRQRNEKKAIKDEFNVRYDIFGCTNMI